MELVSILMPCRDAAPWIGRALESALGQTWPRIEVIVVDDGSTDASHGIVRRYAGANCRVVRQDPRGASAARNRAFSLAQGDYIQFLDADDWLAPDKIARQMTAMCEKGPRALSWSSAIYLHHGHRDHRCQREEAREPCASGAEFLARLWGGEGDPGMVLVHQWLTSRDLVERAGPWNESLSVDDDGEFFARVVLRAASRCAVPQATCAYRKHHHRRNLSAAGPRASAMEAACLKAGYLLGQRRDDLARRAVSRLLTQQIVDAYPHPAHRRGLELLSRHNLTLAREIEAPPWFQRAQPVLGWKAARRLQDFARAWRVRRAAERT